MIFAHFRLILRILDDASQFQIIYVYSRLFLRILYGGCVQDQSVRRTLDKFAYSRWEVRMLDKIWVNDTRPVYVEGDMLAWNNANITNYLFSSINRKWVCHVSKCTLY